jgi:hypothetical protein
MTATAPAAVRRHPTEPGVLDRIADPIASLLGLVPTLTAIDAVTGERRSFPTVRPFEHAGARYLVSRCPEADWVRHLRCAAWAELRIHWRRELVLAWEVEGAERERIVAACRASSDDADRRGLDRLPGPVSGPVFRIVAGAPSR